MGNTESSETTREFFESLKKKETWQEKNFPLRDRKIS